MKFLSDVRLLLTGLWLGAAVFFIGVAQSAFAVLENRELAGAVVGRTLTILNVSGLIIAVILVLTSLAVRAGTNRLMLWAERILLILLAAACAVGQFGIGLWMQYTRAQMGGRPIEELAADDPLRMQFDKLHNYSEWALMTAMGAALIAFFLIAARRFGGPAGSTSTTTSDPFDFTKEFKKA